MCSCSDNISTIITALGGLASLAAVIVAWLAIKSSSKVAESQIFLELRKAHSEIHGQMDSRYHDNGWNPKTDARAFKSIEKYWLHTLTEWYVTKKLDNGKFSKLWDEYYTHAISGGLRNKPLRIVLWEMLYGKPGSTFSGHRKVFGEQMEAIYKKAYNQELKDAI